MLPQRALLALALFAFALPALAAPLASASPVTSCHASPLGHVCSFDAQGDGVPERVYLMDPNQRYLVLLDLWHRPGFDALDAGANVPLPGFGLESARATVAAYDANSDHFRERTDARVEAMSWSNLGGWATVRAWDGNSNGVPEWIEIARFTTKTGFESQRIKTGLA